MPRLPPPGSYPRNQRDWLLATLRNSPEAYAGFIADHQTDAEGEAQNPLIEKAYFRKADRSNSLGDLRETKALPEWRIPRKVLEKIATWGGKKWKAFKKTLVRSRSKNTWPISRMLPVCLKWPKPSQSCPQHNSRTYCPKWNRPTCSQWRQNPLPANCCNTAGISPTDAPERLATAASQPESVPSIQPVLEKIVIARVKNATKPEEVRLVLPALETLGRPEALRKVEKLVQKNPALRQELQAEIAEATQTSAAAEVQRAEEERQRRAAAEKAKQDSLAQVKIQQEATDKLLKPVANKKLPNAPSKRAWTAKPKTDASKKALAKNLSRSDWRERPRKNAWPRQLRKVISSSPPWYW
nr:hypothetical protein [Haliscomenobacter sp.]